MEKNPSLFATVLRLSPLWSFFMMTVAPGTTAPLGSVTVPVSVPLAFCAPAGRVRRMHRQHINAIGNTAVRKLHRMRRAWTVNGKPAERQAPELSVHVDLRDSNMVISPKQFVLTQTEDSILK